MSELFEVIGIVTTFIVVPILILVTLQFLVLYMRYTLLPMLINFLWGDYNYTDQKPPYWRRKLVFYLICLNRFKRPSQVHENIKSFLLETGTNHD